MNWTNWIYKKFRNLTGDYTEITYSVVSHSNHHTRIFSVLLWGCNWIQFMHEWFCPICLIHLIGRKFIHFEKLECCCPPCEHTFRIRSNRNGKTNVIDIDSRFLLVIPNVPISYSEWHLVRIATCCVKVNFSNVLSTPTDST